MCLYSSCLELVVQEMCSLVSLHQGNSKNVMSVTVVVWVLGIKVIGFDWVTVDFLTGNVSRTLKWMREHGFEWFYCFTETKESV